MNFSDQILSALAGQVARLPEPALHFLCGGADRRGFEQLDARLQLGLWLSRTRPPMEAGTPAEAREMSQTDAFNIERIDLPRVEDFSVRGPSSAPPVRVRVYDPRPADGSDASPASPALVYFHGGGFVIGSLDSFDRALRLVARESSLPVFSVDYRLAPEHKYPAAVEDAATAYGELHRRAAEFGINPERLGVGGDSAGGNIAVNVCMQARAGTLPRPSFQALVYPWLDGSGETDSHRQYAAGYGLTRELIAWFIGHAMPTPEYVHTEVASPLLAAPERFKGLPPAYIALSGFDPLRDEGHRYHERLCESGVASRLEVYPSLIHGILSMGGVVPEVRRLLVDYASAVRRLSE